MDALRKGMSTVTQKSKEVIKDIASGQGGGGEDAVNGMVGVRAPESELWAI